MTSIDENAHNLREATDAVFNMRHDLVVEQDSKQEVLADRDDVRYQLRHCSARRSELLSLVKDLEKSNCEFRVMVVDLHTEIQRLKESISEKEDLITEQRAILESKKLHRSCEDRDMLISDFNEVVKEWKDHHSVQFRNSYHAIQKVSDLIDEWVNDERPVEETPDVVVKVAFLELP